MMKTMTCLAAAVAMSVSGAAADGAVDFKAGFAKKDITPELGTTISG